MGMTTTPAQFEELLTSSYRTSDLAGMALNWYEREDGRTPLWLRISSDEESAREFYAACDDETLREMAVDTLISGGWTYRNINSRKS